MKPVVFMADSLSRDEQLPGQDAQLLPQLRQLCHRGQDFYRHCAREARSANLRQISRDMASELNRLATLLNRNADSDSHMPPRNESAPDAEQSPINRLDNWYREALELTEKEPQTGSTQTDSTELAQFGKALVMTENSLLRLLKTVLRQLSDRDLARRLSEPVANLQIIHDERLSRSSLFQRSESGNLFGQMKVKRHR